MTKGYTRYSSQPVHYVVWESIPGGMETYISHYAERFSPERDVYVYSLRPVGNQLKIKPADHFRQGATSNWECYRKYYRYCRDNRKDVFHLMNSGPFILLLTLLAGVRQVVYHIHGTRHWRTPLSMLIRKAVWSLIGLFPVRYVANSMHSARMFRKQVLPFHPIVIYNGFELSKYLKKRRQRKEFKRMGYIGRFDHGKNAHLTIRLFEEIAGRMPELELHLAGGGDLTHEIEEQIRNSPYRDRITLHGWVDDVASLYQSVDLFVFLSDHESFGNVIAEALLTGLPVLTSDVPVFREIYGDEPLFNLGAPSDYAAVKEKFLKAIADYPTLAQKAYGTADRLISLFDMETHFEKIETFYETVFPSRPVLPFRRSAPAGAVDAERSDNGPQQV